MYTQHYNDLTESQHERLSLLLEEMGEAQQLIGKIMRHGYESFHPDHQDVMPATNREDLEREIGHVLYAIHLLGNWHDLDRDRIEAAEIKKSAHIKKYLHHHPK